MTGRRGFGTNRSYVEKLLAQAHAAGLRLDIEDDRLIVRGPAGCDDLLKALRVYKNDIAALLVHQQESLQTHAQKRSHRDCSPGGKRDLVQAEALFRHFRDKLLRVVESIAPKACELGWTRHQLFFMGYGQNPPGLIGFLNPGDAIVGVKQDRIDIISISGMRRQFPRPDLANLA